MTAGKVYLVGAGPGDPGLATLKAAEALRSADVVVYDYLANPELLEFAPAGAECIYVGKQAGAHTLSQDEINALLVAKGKEGRTVVRLKGGDPFVFGRGGEEAEALVDAGIPFEVVPGVTAAIAVPAYAGIPVTHRDWTATVAFVTGHEDPTKDDSSIAWDKLATGIGTIVFYMGMGNLPMITERLIRHGRAPETPIALIRWGTKPEQRTLVGTLATISEDAAEAAFKSPVIIIVGEVVRLRRTLNWFESRPLFGKKIIVTRARGQASEFSRALQAQGAETIEFPTIAIVPPKSWEALDAAIGRLEAFGWVIFTSANGVCYFMERLRAAGKDARALGRSQIAAIGSETAAALDRHGLRADLVPSEFKAEGVVEAFKPHPLSGVEVLIPRAREARDVLPRELEKMGARVTIATAYETEKPSGPVERVEEMLNRREISAVTFTSSSTVRNFAAMFEGRNVADLLDGTVVASIGPVTADTARELGIGTTVMPDRYTIPALVSAIVEYFQSRA